MLFPMGISNEKSAYDKWGQNKIPKISQLKDIINYRIKNIINIIKRFMNRNIQKF